MPDYKKMYLRLFRAVESAIALLIEAQRVCEELYMEADDEEEDAAAQARSAVSDGSGQG